jgi:uncharacterized MAPEG superfamily protein
MLSNMPAIEVVSVLLAASLVWLSALVQHFTNVIKRGARYVMSDRSVAPDMEGFFGRATRTLSNNIESALMYVPPVLLLIILGRTSSVTQLVAAVYVGARCVFSIAYWLELSPIRSLAWLTGMICCAVAVSCAVLALAGR